MLLLEEVKAPSRSDLIIAATRGPKRIRIVFSNMLVIAGIKVFLSRTSRLCVAMAHVASLIQSCKCMIVSGWRRSAACTWCHPFRAPGAI
jgi:hypothetical protein